MDEEESSSWSLGNFLVFIIASAVFIYVARDWGSYVLPKNWFILIELVLVYLASLFPFWMSRYRMPQVQADGFHGSFQHNESPIPVKDYYLVKDPKDSKQVKRVHFNWLVYACGSSLYPVPVRGKDAVLIVPEQQMDTRAKNHHSSTQVFLTPLIKLPPVLFNFLSEYKSNYNTKKIYIGTFPRSYVPKDFDDADKDLQIKSLNSQVNTLNKMLSGDFSGFEKIKNLVDKINPKQNLVEKIFADRPEQSNVPAN